MIKEKIKPIATAILSTAFAIIFAMGLVACASEEEENAPSSFVCAETGLTIELSEDESYYIVTDCPEDKREVVINESYYGKPVKEIGENAFDGCENLTKVSIPDCMISINSKALSACKNLEYTETKDSKYLGNENNPYVYLAKYLSGDIATVVVENNCKAIGDYAFYKCDNLKYLSLPDGLVSIGRHAFHGCDKLDSVSLPDGLVSIGNCAFGYCAFTSIKLPASLTNIGAYAFTFCQSLRSVTIPNGITRISERLFQGCYRLRKVSFGENLIQIGPFAFAESGLESVTIPDGVTSIGFNAFAGCGRLTSVSIPASVKEIGAEVFFNCSDLTTIYFNGTKAQWEKIKKGNMWDFNGYAKEINCTDGMISLSER